MEKKEYKSVQISNGDIAITAKQAETLKQPDGLDGFYVGETVYVGPHKVTIEKFMKVFNGNGKYTNFAITSYGWWTPTKELVKIKK